MGASAIFFIVRRYGLNGIKMGVLAFALGVIVLATMYARVMLDAHTITAVIAGALVGLICALCFSSKKMII